MNRLHCPPSLSKRIDGSPVSLCVTQRRKSVDVAPDMHAPQPDGPAQIEITVGNYDGEPEFLSVSDAKALINAILDAIVVARTGDYS